MVQPPCGHGAGEQGWANPEQIIQVVSGLWRDQAGKGYPWHEGVRREKASLERLD